MSEIKKIAKSVQGKVISNKMKNTLGVLVERKIKHPILGKYLLRSKKYSVDNKIGSFNIGDIVSIRECKPISRKKSWEVVGGVSKARGS